MRPRISSEATISTSSLFWTTFLIVVINGITVTTAAEKNVNVIGAIIDMNSHVGKQIRVGMEVAVQSINNISTNGHTLSLTIIDSHGNPLQAFNAAKDLVKEGQVQAILGMQTWPEVAYVAEITDKSQIPIISFATPSVTPPSATRRWPFLVNMAIDDSQQIQCVASIVASYGWTKVIAIYEGDGYSSDSRILTLLSDKLQANGSEIEHWLAFPPFSTLIHPTSFVREELEKLKSKQSRVFIMVGLSIELATYIFQEAENTGLIEKDSVWITTDSLLNLVDTLNSSVIHSMEGVIGLKTHFSDSTQSFKDFAINFRRLFQSLYPQKEKSEPGIFALRAHDAISTVALALEKSTPNNGSTASRKLFLDNILTSNISGLSGQISFQGRELSLSTTYEIINVLRSRYIPLKFWSNEYGFSSIDERSREKNHSGHGTFQVLGGHVYWPRDLDRVPKGWKIPTVDEPLIIGVPNSTFPKFVSWKHGEPQGFCIEVFHKARALLEYDLHYKFVESGESYNDLVLGVYHKKFDVVVGDITILANRSMYVDFTAPYMESGLTMVVPVKPEERTWLIVKPFTPTLWMVVGIVFMYTAFVVWFMEHRSNQEFRGSWRNQLSTAMWFTCSTLFFAHRESLRSNFTRVVLFVWLLAIFVVTSSYTASLTSMLTVKRLEPALIDTDTLKMTNSRVGFDSVSFVKDYIQGVLGFHPNNTIAFSNEHDYQLAFKNGTIRAAFLELPYERDFLSRYPKDFKDAGLKNRLGGFGFAFPKGSLMAKDFSKAFLTLSEEGQLDDLEKIVFPQRTLDSTSDDESDKQTLGLEYFTSLFLFTGITSTIMLALYIFHLIKKFRRSSVQPDNSDNSVWIGIQRLGSFYRNRSRYQNSEEGRDIRVLISPNSEFQSEDTSTHSQSTQVAEVSMSEANYTDLNNPRRALRVANSFPNSNGRILRFNADTLE